MEGGRMPLVPPSGSATVIAEESILFLLCKVITTPP